MSFVLNHVPLSLHLQKTMRKRDTGSTLQDFRERRDIKEDRQCPVIPCYEIKNKNYHKKDMVQFMCSIRLLVKKK